MKNLKDLFSKKQDTGLLLSYIRSSGIDIIKFTGEYNGSFFPLFRHHRPL